MRITDEEKNIVITFRNGSIEVETDSGISGERLVLAIGALVIAFSKEFNITSFDMIHQVLPEVLENWEVKSNEC